MRRSSSTMSRWGASSASAADSVFMARMGLMLLGAWSARAAGARNEPQHAFAIVDIDHGDQEAASRFVGVRPELGERARNAAGLQPGELQGERFTLRGDEQQPLAPVVGAFLLQHIALIDELLQHPPERLLGDLQNVEQLRNLHARIAIDEMQDPMVGAPEVELGQGIIGLADKVSVGEEQKLDNVPDGLKVRSRVIGGGRS